MRPSMDGIPDDAPRVRRLAFLRPLVPRVALAITLLLAQATAARAEDQRARAAAAEALFQQGRTLLMAGQVAQACPKLEESQRLDPATGTLLALALCHEQQGKLASAWAAFAEVEGRSRLDGRADRQRTAREHGAALGPRLSTLTLQLDPQVAELAGLVILVDGVAIGRGAWSVAIPVDGGRHLVEATAPARTTWHTSVSVEPERDHVRVEVPALASAADLRATSAPQDPAPAPLVDGSAGERPRPAPAPTGAIIALASSGVLALGLGTALLIDARRDYQAARADCGTACVGDPYERVQAARRQGNWATVSFIAGGLLLASGAALWLWTPAAAAPSAGKGGVAMVLRPDGLLVSGQF